MIIKDLIRLRREPIDYSKSAKVNGYEFTILRESFWKLYGQLGKEVSLLPASYTLDDKRCIMLPEETVCNYTEEMIDFTIYTEAYLSINDIKVRWLEDLHQADVFAYYKMENCDASIVRKIYEATKEAMDDNYGNIYRWWNLRYNKSILDEREQLLRTYIEEHGKKDE